MRKTLLVFLLVVISWQLFAQENQVQKKTYIYLWDVTLSMKGFEGKTPDIYDKVVNWLCNEIKSFELDPTTEIIVCPFQTTKQDSRGVLDVWKFNATALDTARLNNKIRTYPEQGISGTDIVSAWEFARRNLIKDSHYTQLVILTDGLQSPGKEYGGLERLCQQIDLWGKFSKDRDCFAWYVMLTKEAENHKITEAIDDAKKKQGKIEQSTGEICEQVSITLTPQDVRLNLKDYMSHHAEARLVCTQDKSASSNISPRAKLIVSDHIGILEQTTYDVEFAYDQSTNTSTALLDLKFKYVYDELKLMLPDNSITTLPVQIEITNNGSQTTSSDQAASFTYKIISYFNIQLVNKREKTLEIIVL